MLIADSESDGFKYEATKIWVVACYATHLDQWWLSFDNYEQGKYYMEFTDIRAKSVVFETHAKLLHCMQEQSVCFHNYFQHDKPLIKKFYPWFQPKEEHDSYILSQLFNPDREIPKGCKGAHGLDAWSRRVGREGKVVHEDWSKFSPEMLHRVIEDVKDNVAAWKVLMQEKKEWEDLGYSWDEAIKIEYSIADLQGRQELFGVKLDIDKAYVLADEIYQEIQKIDETLLASMPPRVIRGSEVLEPFKKDGNLKKVVEDWFK